MLTLPTAQNENGLGIVSEGILNCWHGRYHYIEPWIGCEHNCLYCYAKDRISIQNGLQKAGTSFCNPKPLLNEDALLKTLSDELVAKGVIAAKLCRYTDILSPSFVRSGLSFNVLKTICDSPVKRIIITTKGIPSPEIIGLLAEQKHKISFNIGARPQNELAPLLEPNVPSLEKRLEGAAELAKQGVEVTLHIDPIVIGFDDEEKCLSALLDLFLKYNLKKVVFSHLLFSEEGIKVFEEAIGTEKTGKILAQYQLSDPTLIVRKDLETVYYQPLRENHKQSILKITGMLQERNFNFVLCSLKAKNGVTKEVQGETHICNGRFYA